MPDLPQAELPERLHAARANKKGPTVQKNDGAFLKRDLGNDLLSHQIGSTIGAAGLNFSVRNGKR